MLAISLITCVTLTQAPSDPPQSIATAPQLPPWPPGLSAPAEGPDGVLLPPDRAEATYARLRACQSLPGRCQVRLDAIWSTCDALVSGARLVERADCLGARVDDQIAASSMWPAWRVAAVALVVAVVAGGAGYVAGAVAHGRP